MPLFSAELASRLGAQGRGTESGASAEQQVQKDFKAQGLGEGREWGRADVAMENISGRAGFLRPTLKGWKP